MGSLGWAVVRLEQGVIGRKGGFTQARWSTKFSTQQHFIPQKIMAIISRQPYDDWHGWFNPDSARSVLPLIYDPVGFSSQLLITILHALPLWFELQLRFCHFVLVWHNNEWAQSKDAYHFRKPLKPNECGLWFSWKCLSLSICAKCSPIWVSSSQWTSPFQVHWSCVLSISS